MRRYRVSHADHLEQPWLVHELLGDFTIEDIWQFPVRLRPDDSLIDFQQVMTAAVRDMGSMSPVALLFRVRALA